jgi:hypothetical protein
MAILTAVNICCPFSVSYVICFSCYDVNDFGSMYFLFRFQPYKIFNMLYFKEIEKNSVKVQILKIH